MKTMKKEPNDEPAKLELAGLFSDFLKSRNEGTTELPELTMKVFAATVRGVKTFRGGTNPSESALLLSVMHELQKLLRLEISGKLAANSTLEMARLRGETSKLELLDEAGPMVTAGQAAEALGISKQAVHKRLQSGTLFGIMSKGEFRIPAWQIREGEVVPGISEVLRNLDTTEWGKMLFFHSENMQLEGHRPMDLILGGDVKAVAAVAALFGEEGAK
jgi:hypothetical protein